MSNVRNFKDQPQAPARRASHETEQAVVATILRQSEVVPEILAGFIADDFHLPRHQTVFAAVTALDERGDIINANTIYDETCRMPQAPGVESLDDLRAIVRNTQALDTAGIKAAKATLREYTHRRQLIDRCYEAISRAESPDATPTSIVDFLDVSCDLIRSETAQSGITTFAELAGQMGATYTELHGGKTDAISTGFDGLDNILARGGMRPGQLIVIGAPTGGAKSALGMSIASNVAKAGGGALYFSLEMQADDLYERVHSDVASVPAWQIRPGIYTGEYKKLMDSIAEMSTLNIHVDHRSNSFVQIRRTTRNLVRRPGANIKVIVIDYLQLMRLTDGAQSAEKRYAEVTAISIQLKMLAKELGLPIILLSQISREGAKAKKGERGKHHLKESGQIENDADVVIMIELDPVEQGEDPPKLRPAEIIIDKQRKGPTGSCNLIFDAEHIAFADIADGSALSARLRAPEKEKFAAEIKRLEDEGGDDDAIPF